MPKYFPYKVHGYYLYYTSHCIVECMHAHASDTSLTEAGSAKFFIKENGDTVVQRKGSLKDKDVVRIQKFIKEHYHEMFDAWSKVSKEGFYRGKNMNIF